ncbi:MAG TPA: hypothetical protein VGL38_15060 [bacterium]|jgi:hypothetical protein
MLARFVTFIAVGLMLITGSAFADTTSAAWGHVYVAVVSNIAVSVVTANVNLGSIQTGIFPGEITFRVDANSEAVNLSAAATALYKGDDPTDPTVTPIPLWLTTGALIEPTDASPLQGGSNVGIYETPFNYDGFLGMQTNYIPFESSQMGIFSQDVFVTVAWNQANPEMPTGEYSGFVCLYASVHVF